MKNFNVKAYGGHGQKFKNKLKVSEEILKDFINFKNENFRAIKSPFCNFADAYSTIENYKNVLRFSLGNLTPSIIKIEMGLYHGCEKLVEKQVIQETYFSNNVSFNHWVNFGNLRYCQLPIKSRLSINVILVFVEGFELTIGCVSMNLFDENKKFISGVQDLNLWPFYEIDERLGCMKEYKGRKHDQNENRDDVISNIHSFFSKIVLQFETFISPMFYSSRNINQIREWKLSLNQDDIDDEE
jgi:hypothetical protein